MEDYLLKASISLLVLYASYRLIFWQKQSHQTNRFLGLACIVFSTVLPFFSFDARQFEVLNSETITNLVSLANFDLQQTSVDAAGQTGLNIFFITYLAGAGFFLLRFLKGMLTLLGFYYRSPRELKWGFKVVNVQKQLSPFTFFNILFLGSDKMDDEQMEALLVHEQFHRDEWHSVDSLILEILTIVFWFNPAIWLFQRDIRSEHEYMADKKVLSKGFNLLQYQNLLFQSSTGVAVSVGNHLINKVSLIKRFEMMTQVKSKNTNIYYRLGIHACLIATIFFFSAFTGFDTGVIDTDKPAVYKEGNKEMYRLIKSQIKYPSGARKEGSMGKVNVSFIVNKQGKVEAVKVGSRKGRLMDGVNVVGYASGESAGKATQVNKFIKAEVVRVVNLLGDFTPAEKDGKTVSTRMTIPFEFRIK